MKRYLNAILLITCISAAANAAVSGRAIDPAGKGVYDAMVCYTNIANRLVYVYTDANGYFNIPAPTDWNLNDLPMYKPVPSTAIRAMQLAQSGTSGFSAKANGDLINFFVPKSDNRVIADMYDVSGKRLMRLFDKVVAGSGNYVFDPFVKNETALSHQVYIVRLTNGGVTASVRIMNTGMRKTPKVLDASDRVVSMQTSPELAKAAAVDGIRVGKTGYFATTVQVNTYNDAVGNVTIKVDNIEGRVDSVFALMSVDEKVGQLMQPSLSNQTDVANYLLGSYLKGEGSTAPMTSALSTPRKIPLIVGNDWVHGGRHIYFPHEIGLGCTGDTLLAELAYRVATMCCVVLQNNECFAPCLDVHRSDKSGRVYEGFAETPELTVPFARAAVRGIQGTDLTSGYTMMATLKHWAAGGGTVNGGGHADATTAPNMGVMAKIHFPPFAAAVKAGAAMVMTGYQSVFGSVMATNKQLVTDTLKTAYGFDGVVITDWATAIGKEVACVNAGHDLCMTVTPSSFVGIIKPAVSNGSISAARFTDAVKRNLRVKFRMGLFQNPWPNSNLNNYLASQEYRNVARACVRKSMVLLKNTNNVLPLSKTANVHVVGVWADNMGYQCGGWSATGFSIGNNTNMLNGGDEGWQGTANAHLVPGATTILQGIQAVRSANTYSPNASGIPSTAGVIVVVVGETPYAEDNGDRTDITLASDQIALVQACATAAGTRPVVTILITGRPNALGTIPNNSAALVAAWLPGTEGEGVSDVLFGDYKFSGKLSVTWPASNSQDPINTGNMGDNTGSGGNPLFAYGFGLTD
jgi:beta-glucosidase